MVEELEKSRPVVEATGLTQADRRLRIIVYSLSQQDIGGQLHGKQFGGDGVVSDRMSRKRWVALLRGIRRAQRCGDARAILLLRGLVPDFLVRFLIRRS